MLQNVETVRVWFRKAGAAKYISHLDLTHCMGRALKLSRLPVWYTEGFNPRIYMTYAMPLSLGVAGERECMYIRLTQPVPYGEVADRLGRHLPQGLEVLGAAAPEHKLEETAWADYEIALEDGDSQGLREAVTRLLGREALLVKKHTKKGEREIDIKPVFAGTEVAPRPGGLLLTMRLPCSPSGSVNPSLLLEALKAYENREPAAQITRLRLLLEDFSEIR